MGAKRENGSSSVEVNGDASADFVGRVRELEELRAGLDEALAGQARLFLISGEPGIGKTRLAEELAVEARRRGALTLWGACWEDRGAPAYWPWTQILRGLHCDPGVRQVAEASATDAQRLAQILPELGAGGAGGRPDNAPIEGDDARFALFDAGTSLLTRIAAERPLAIFLDDLHAADPPSLLLLRFVARELRASRILLVGTYRSYEAERSRERSELIAQIGRLGKRIPLSGLDAQQVATLIEQVCAVRPSAALVAAVHQTTEGNPFFVDEVARLLAAEGVAKLPDEQAVAMLRIPHGVREAMRERLRPLSDECRALLEVAAVVGREFEANVLQAASRQPIETVFNRLREATAAGIVRAVPGGLARFAFAHALFRETLYGDELPAERLRLHREIGEALERLHVNEPGPYLAELAYHFFAAAPAGGLDKAATYAARAGEQAAARLAYEDAASHFERALQTLVLSGEHDPRRQCELLLSLGHVQRACSNPASRDTFRRAAEMARRVVKAGDSIGAELLVRTGLGLADRGIGVPNMAGDAEVAALLEEGLAALAPGDHPLRAQALARWSMELSFDESSDRCQEMSRAAVEMARRLNEPMTLAATLSARQYILWRVDLVIDRLTICDEIIRLAEHIGNRELALQGRTWRLVDLMSIGNVHSFDVEIDKQARSADELRQPRYQWMTASLRAMRALWAAQWDQAEAFARYSLLMGERTGDQYASVSPWVQLFVIRRERGQLAQEEAMGKVFAERFPNSPVPRTFLAVIYMELGRLVEARQQFEILASEEFANLERERRVGVLPCLAEVCACVGDAKRAQALMSLLQPYAHGNLPYGAILTFGATSHYIALLKATMGDVDGAAICFEEALDLNERMEARGWLVRSQYEFARLLLARSAPGDPMRAVTLAEKSLEGATTHGMISVAAKAEVLLETARSAARKDTARSDEAARARAYGGGQASSGELPEVREEHVPQTATDTAPRRGRVLSFPRNGGRSTAERRGGERQPKAAESPQRRHGVTPVDAIFRRDGEYWSVGDAASMMRFKDTKGLRYIAQLLRQPDRDIHVSDLVGGEAPKSGDGAGVEGMSAEQLAELGMHAESGESGTGPLLDAQAKSAYRRRIEDLRDQLDEATRFNDVERAGLVRQELKFLSGELARAVGLGGRDRPASAHAEKARLNVTRAIKAVIKRISEHNPTLGRYLSTTIKTGAFCTYSPDPRFPIDWKL